jgi:hypothetical protein
LRAELKGAFRALINPFAFFIHSGAFPAASDEASGMKSNTYHGVALVFLACSSLACGGGRGEGLAEAVGKVTSGGQPAPGAVLTFHRQPGGAPPPANVATISPSATVQEDGTFRVESQPVGYGIAPGSYKICIEWPEAADTVKPDNDVKRTSITRQGKIVVVNRRGKYGNVREDRLKGRLADASKTPISAEIKSGANDLGAFEIEAK